MKGRVERVKMQKISDDGLLCIVEFSKVPFEVKRAYCILEADPELPRGYHAHRLTEQVIFCLKGGLRITLDNGKGKVKLVLNDKNSRGVIQRKLTWIEMDRFQPGTSLLVLASRDYDPGDYIRTYHQFIKETKKRI